MDDLYKSEIFFRNDVLHVAVTYRKMFSAEEERFLREGLREISSKNLGRYVRQEEISLSPRSGEAIECTDTFFIRPGVDLDYSWARRLHSSSPHILPRLIGDLRNFSRMTDIGEVERHLAEYAAEFLTEVISMRL